VQIDNPTQDAVVLGAAVASGAAVALGAARVVVTAGCGVLELAVAACGRDVEDDEHAARPKTAAKITHAFPFATRNPSVTSKDRIHTVWRGLSVTQLGAGSRNAGDNAEVDVR
jgi:hypothetical protein